MEKTKASKLSLFLYLLMRDEVVLGTISRIMEKVDSDDSEETILDKKDTIFNDNLGYYAVEIAGRLQRVETGNQIKEGHIEGDWILGSENPDKSGCLKSQYRYLGFTVRRNFEWVEDLKNATRFDNEEEAVECRDVQAKAQETFISRSPRRGGLGLEGIGEAVALCSPEERPNSDDSKSFWTLCFDPNADGSNRRYWRGQKTDNDECSGWTDDLSISMRFANESNASILKTDMLLGGFEDNTMRLRMRGAKALWHLVDRGD